MKRPLFDQSDKYLASIPQPCSGYEESFRHGHWQARRGRVRAAIGRGNPTSIRCIRWDCCGSDARTEWSETLQKRRIRANYCHDRFCEPCQRAKANRIAANLKCRLGEKPKGRYRFVTLTLQHSETDLKEQIKRLYSSFRQLRATKLWKQVSEGGAFILEIKHGKTGWHPHMHVIHEGGWLDQNEVSAAWHKITGDSFIVDITAIRDEKETAHYVTKYMTKGTTSDVWDDANLAFEFICAMMGTRTCGTFGTWRKFKLNQIVQRADDWVLEATLNQWVSRARSGEEHAARIMADLRPPGDFDAHIPQ